MPESSNNKHKKEGRSMEVRNLIEDVEFRSEGTRLLATGYAARFNALSQNLGGFVERIAPGAFAKTLKEADTFSRTIKADQTGWSSVHKGHYPKSKSK